jgi:hypothetical protein
VAIGFRRPSSPGLDLARSWDLNSVDGRLARLGQRIDALEASERQLLWLREHIASQAPASVPAAVLWVALAELRRIAAQASPESTRQLLERCERTAAQAARETGTALARLEEALADGKDLRGGLNAYKEKANDRGLVEDVELAELYRRAYALLWRSPTDLPAARAAVQDYLAAVRRRRNGRR